MLSLDPEWVISIGLAAFLGIVFLQSGLDKILDFSGNLEFISQMFANAPVRVPVAPLLVCVTVAEVIAGGLSAAGALALLLGAGPVLAYWGAVFSGISLLMVLFGQRLSKAYADAAVLAPYVLVTCLAVYMLGG